MPETEKEHKISKDNIKQEFGKLTKNLLTKVSLLLDTLRIQISKTLKTLGDAIIARINQRNELKQIEREAYKEELTELIVKRHDRAIELAKERGRQKAHGRKHKSQLTEAQLKTIEIRRKQLTYIGKNLSSLIGNTSVKPKNKKTKEDLKAEIERTKLEHELAELKKKPKTKGIQIGISPSLLGGRQSNALDNVMSCMSIHKKK